MKIISTPLPLFLVSSLLFSACSGQNQTSTVTDSIHLATSSKPTSDVPLTPLYFLPFLENLKPLAVDQIGEYVREIFQDSQGNLWFGTLKYGVCRYNGDNLTYFSTKEGIVGNQINGITEDRDGNLWFSTTTGVSRFDGKSFVNYTEVNGLRNNRTWSILADSRGNVWVGTVQGISRFDGQSFSDFDLPVPDIKNPSTALGLNCVRNMIEDSAGNLWFARDGYGVCKFDGKDFTHYTTENGLCSNAVVALMQDNGGNLWFSSIETPISEADNSNRFVTSDDGGLSMFDGRTFKQFPDVTGLSRNDVDPIYQDTNGDIWIASKHHGVYKYNGETFELFSETGPLTNNCIQAILEDKSGNLWFGFSGGLFRLRQGKFENVTQQTFLKTGC